MSVIFTQNLLSGRERGTDMIPRSKEKRRRRKSLNSDEPRFTGSIMSDLPTDRTRVNPHRECCVSDNV